MIATPITLTQLASLLGEAIDYQATVEAGLHRVQGHDASGAFVVLQGNGAGDAAAVLIRRKITQD